MARLFWAVFFAVVAASYRPQPVAAQALPRPPLATEACLAEETAALEQALALELRRRMMAAARAGTTPPHFLFGCEGQLVLIRIFAGRGERMLERTIDVLSTPPAARTRLMALAAAELGDSLWDDPEQSSVTTTAAARPSLSAALAVVVTPAPPPTAIPTVAAVPPVTTLRRLLYVSADVRAFRGAAGLLAGAGVGAALRREGGGPGATVDLVLNGATRQLALGRGTIALLSSRPAVTATIDLHRLYFTAAGGARVGVARLGGTPNAADVAGTTIWGLWGGPSLSASAGWSPFRRGTLTLLVEGGWTLARVVGRQGGAPALSLSGPWTAIQVGAGWP